MTQGIASFMGGSTKEQQLRQQTKEQLLNNKTPIQKRRERRAGLKGGEGADSGIGKFATQLGVGVLPGSGVADVVGAFPDVEGGYEPSMLVNLQQAKRSFQEGNYKQAAVQGIFGGLQGLGGASDVALAAFPFAPFALPIFVGGKTVSTVGKSLVKKVFPVPQRMLDPSTKDFKPFLKDVGFEKGGKYLDVTKGENVDITGQKPTQAQISVPKLGEGDKAKMSITETNENEIDSIEKGAKKIKTNLFKKEKGWKWTKVPEGYEPNPDGKFPIISVETGGKHFYTLNTDFPQGVELSRYAKQATEPRLRPTVKGRLEFGEPVGEITVRGKSHLVYDKITARGGGKGIAALPTEQGARKVKERTRIGTTGQYIGAPQGIDSPQKLASLRRKIKGLAIEGSKGRYWYESSGKEILDAVGGDVAEADKIVQAIAITSPQTPVKTNFDYALQAYAQHKAGQPIKTGRFPQAMSKKLQDLFDGKKWEGRKTDDFYNNLMIHIDPERAGPVTGDIWMVRAFGFDKDGGPAPQQYKFITNEIQKISDELGWKPHQTQASVWVNAKARQENPEVKKRTMEKSLKKGFIEYKTNAKGKQEVVYKNKPEHLKLWFKESFDYTPTEAEIQKAGFDYADALKNNLGQISWESIPHNTTNHLKGLEQSTPNIKAAYHTDLSKVFLDDKGRDLIAQKLGMVSPGDFEAPGYYQGIVNPGTQTEVVAVKGYKTGKINKIEKSQEDLIEAYSVARGILMKQESVAWHRPFYSATKKDSNGIELNIGRPFSIDEIDDYAKEISKITGNKEYNPISTPEGVRIINYNNKFDNKEFQGLINQATENFSKKLDKSTDVKVEYFSSQNGYLENNWKKDKNGQGYLQRLRKEGQSDLYRKVYDIIEELQPRIDDVDAKFRDEYGFELNEEINSGFRNRNLTDDGSVSVDVKTEKPIKKIEQKSFGGFIESSNYDHYRII